MTRRLRHLGFTLIELLVVITIIVVLLALLTPSLDKAIYQAELAVCGANLKAIGSGATNYAAASRRTYPTRGIVAGNRGGGPDQLGQKNAWDDRPRIMPYVGLNAHNDPLHEAVDNRIEPNRPATLVFSGYNLWYGWQYNVEGTAYAGMFKLGNRFGWVGTEETTGQPRRYRFSALASDEDAYAADEGLLTNGHPDADGVMYNLVLQDQEYEGVVSITTGGAVSAGSGTGVILQTTSRWYSEATHVRGETDHNYAFADGSVERFNGVVIRPDPPFNNDERMALVPQTRTAAGAGGTNLFGEWWIQIPPK